MHIAGLHQPLFPQKVVQESKRAVQLPLLVLLPFKTLEYFKLPSQASLAQLRSVLMSRAARKCKIDNDPPRTPFNHPPNGGYLNGQPHLILYRLYIRERLHVHGLYAVCPLLREDLQYERRKIAASQLLELFQLLRLQCGSARASTSFTKPGDWCEPADRRWLIR